MALKTGAGIYRHEVVELFGAPNVRSKIEQEDLETHGIWAQLCEGKMVYWFI